MSAARQFYVDELVMFSLQGELWDSICRLRALDSEDIELHLTEHNREPSPPQIFLLKVPDCKREFSRLKATIFFKWRSAVTRRERHR